MAELEPIDAGIAGVVAGFTTRHGGVSGAPWDSLNLGPHVGDDLANVSANADRLAAHLGVAGVCIPRQVHGADVRLVDQAPQGLLTHTLLTHPLVDGVDALVTAQPGIALAVLVADCVPVLLADPSAGILGVAHAGRRGLASGVLQATVAAMVDLGAEPRVMSAVVGPAICGRCYEVPETMRAEVDALVPGTATQTRAGTPGLDLPSGAVAVLTAAGIAEVSATGLCTAEDDRFFSYRRDGVTGRFAGFAMLAQQ